jgi:antitoxin component YwqK of YwqJK toxin-antitoxin module
MKQIATILILLTGLLAYGQEFRDLSTIKFWTYGSDTGYATVRYDDGSEKQVVDRIRKNDTIYEFYINGLLKGKGPIVLDKTEKIIQVDGSERTQETYSYNGKWTIYYRDSLERIAQTGYFKDHQKTGEWITYSINGKIAEKTIYREDGRTVENFDSLEKLISKTEYAYNGLGETRIVEDVEYENGKESYKTNDSELTRFFHKNAELIMIIFFLSFFLRVPINHIIYNRQENKENVLFWFPGRGNYFESLFHGLRCMWTFWWFKFRPENKGLVTSNLILSIISILIFVIGIIASK